MSGLEHPSSASELYLARGNEVEVFRPVMTGDVFDSVEIPGVEGGPGLAMVISHPCSMRRGPHLREYLHMAAVRTGAPIGLEQWDGNFSAMPLPELRSAGAMTDRAELELSGRVRSDVLDPRSRLACMDPKGVLLLMQRISNYWTRYPPDLEALLGTVGHVLDEAELLEEWVSAKVIDPKRPDLLDAIRVAEGEFDSLLSAPREGGTLRRRLLDPATRASVRRAVRTAIGS